MAFSRVSTGESDIPSSCEMKQEPEFKPMQGYPAIALTFNTAPHYNTATGDDGESSVGGGQHA